jgi:hypothetical protein
VKHWKKALAAFAFMVIALMITIGLLTQQTPTPGYVPLSREEHQALFDAEENGYHLLQEAMDGIDSSLSEPFRQEPYNIASVGSASALAREYITNHEESINTAHSALKLEPFIIPPYSLLDQAQHLRGARDMALLLVFNGHLQRVDGNSGAMLENYLDTLRLGNVIAKHGAFPNGMISITIERMALLPLYDALNILDEQQLKNVIEALDTFQVERVPFQHIIANEKALGYSLTRQQLNPFERMFMPQINITTNRILEPAFAGSRHLFEEIATIRIATTLRARVTLHELEHGESPDSLEKVMNGASVPLDPLTGNLFQYQNGKISSHDDFETKEIDMQSVF